MIRTRRAAALRTALLASGVASLLVGAGVLVAPNAARRHPVADVSSPAALLATGQVASTGEVRKILEEEARSGRAEALLELALFLQRAGDGEGSLRTLQRVAREHPRFARGRQYLGVAYLALRRVPQARMELWEAVRLSPGDVEARIYFGMALQALGEVRAAESEYRRAQQTDPQAPSPYFALAQLDNGPAGYPQALANLESFIARTSRPGPGFHLMSQIYAHKGERESALKFARKAVESDPENVRFWHQLGLVYHGMSGPDSLPAAMRCYEEALRRSPRDGAVWFDLGRAQMSAHRWQEAIQAFRAARAADPGNMEISYHLGRALQATGAPDEAQRELRRYRVYSDYIRRRAPIAVALARQPANSELLVRMAELCLEFRQYAAASSSAGEALAARSVPEKLRQRARRVRESAELALTRLGTARGRAAP